MRCAICMTEELEMDEVYSLIGCGHTFCNECILDQLFTIARGDVSMHAAHEEDGGCDAGAGVKNHRKQQRQKPKRKFSLIVCPLPECKKAVSSWELKESFLPARKRLLAATDRGGGSSGHCCV